MIYEVNILENNNIIDLLTCGDTALAISARITQIVTVHIRLNYAL